MVNRRLPLLALERIRTRADAYIYERIHPKKYAVVSLPMLTADMTDHASGIYILIIVDLARKQVRRFERLLTP